MAVSILFPAVSNSFILKHFRLRSWIGSTHDHSVYSRDCGIILKTIPSIGSPFVKTYNKRATVGSSACPVGSANIILLQTDLISHNSRAQ